MNADRLLAHYERIADAPDAIARLRRFILDLAVRGKLVPQDANHELASELLKRIGREKARLVKAGDLRKPRELDGGNESVEPFVIPSSWRWVRLDTVGAIVGGGTPSATDAENFAEPGEGVPWLTPADLGGYSDLYVSRGSRDLSEKGSRASSATLMPKGTVLFTSRAPIGYVAIAANVISTNQGFKSIVPYVTDCSRFIATAMKAFAPDIDAKAPGTTFKEVSGKIVAAVPFPLPPLAEQRRIVVKVDELMGLCDRLEAARAGRKAVRDRLAAASLARLNAPDPDTFQADARFALDALPALTTRPDQIKRLRQTILNLAVRGKLVTQDAGDEPASELLKRIAKEIAAYGKANRIGQAQAEPIADNDVPFAAPNGWRWTRLCALFNVITDGDHQPPPKADKGVAFLTIGNVTTGRLDFTGCRLVPEAYFKSLAPYRTPAKGDILYTVVGATYGRPAFVETDRAFCVQRHIAILKPVEAMSLRFLMALLASPLIYNQATRTTTGTAQPTIALRPLRNFLAPLPPLAEQHRIVAKVDALMALCDRLEASLTAASANRSALLQALLHEALDDNVLDKAA